MPPIQICPFDPAFASPARWEAFHACRRAIADELSPGDPVLSDEETRIELLRPVPLRDVRRWVAVMGDEIIGSAHASFRHPAAPNAAEHAPHVQAGGAVRAAARRQGAGTLLLREVLGLMHELDKTVLTLHAHTAPGHAFLTHAGAIAKHSAVESRAVLAQLDWPRLRAWEETVADSGLAWEIYTSRVPREVLLALLPVFDELLADVPLGALDIPPPRSEISVYDHWYEMMVRTGGAHHLVLLRTPGGAVAGISDATWDSRSPEIVWQAFTGVARSWRGRGVAQALKAALLRHVHARHPEARVMATCNADENAPILSINARVGFAVHRRMVDYQITRTALDTWHQATHKSCEHCMVRARGTSGPSRTQ